MTVTLHDRFITNLKTIRTLSAERQTFMIWPVGLNDSCEDLPQIIQWSMHSLGHLYLK